MQSRLRARNKGEFISERYIKIGDARTPGVIDHISGRNGISLRLLARAPIELFLSFREGFTFPQALS